MNQKILIVDDEAPIRGVLEELLSGENYECRTASNAYEALDQLQEFKPDLLISDIRMPVMDGVQLLNKAREVSPDIAVVMITAVMEIDIAVSILKQGASDYITKPFNLQDVVERVRSALQKRSEALAKKRYQDELEAQVKQRTEQLRLAFSEIEIHRNFTLEALVTALDAREHETQAHSLRVRDYSLALGQALGLDEESMDALGEGALLHDVGKIGISDTILLKKGPLTSDEWLEMQKHPEIGHQILSGINFLKRTVINIVLTHHEKFDGSGYPGKMGGVNIPLESRIFSVADALDAITSDRPYRAAKGYRDASQEIVRCQGKHFDPQVVEAFLTIQEDQWKEIRAKADRTKTEVGRSLPILNF